MIAQLNILAMVISAIYGSYLYIKSVRPAKLEREIGGHSYEKCTRYRYNASMVLSITVICYFVYYSYPLAIPLPRVFPWKSYISLLISVLIVIPALWIFIKGRRDMGREAVSTKKYHKLFTQGIYDKIRHPQHTGEVSFWFVIAFFLNSPFLVLVSFLWIPNYIIWCIVEENDLILRFGDEYREYRKRTGFFFPRLIKKD